MWGEVLGRVLARGVSAIAQAVLFLFLASEMGAARFGDFSALWVLLTLAFIFFSGGVSGFALRLSATSDEKDLAGEVLSVAWIAALVATILVGGVALLLEFTTLPIVMAAGVLVLGESTAEVLAAVLSGLHRVRAATAFIVLRRFVLLAATLGFYRLLRDAAISVVAASLLCMLPYLVVMRRSGWGTLKGKARVLREARPFWRAGLAGQIVTLDVTLVRAVLGSATGGSYATAARAVSPLQLVPGSLLGVLVPRLSTSSDALAAGVGRRVKAMGVVLAGVVLVGAVSVALVAPQALGPEFEGLGLLALALGAGVALSCYSQVLQAGLVSRGHASTAAQAVLWGSIFGLFLLLAVIAVGGDAGLPIGAVSVQMCVLVAMSRADKKASAT